MHYEIAHNKLFKSRFHQFQVSAKYFTKNNYNQQSDVSQMTSKQSESLVISIPYLQNFKRKHKLKLNSFGSRYSRMDQEKFVEICLSRSYHFKFFKGCHPLILRCPFLNNVTHLTIRKSISHS